MIDKGYVLSQEAFLGLVASRLLGKGRDAEVVTEDDGTRESPYLTVDGVPMQISVHMSTRRRWVSADDGRAVERETATYYVHVGNVRVAAGVADPVQAADRTVKAVLGQFEAMKKANDKASADTALAANFAVFQTAFREALWGEEPQQDRCRCHLYRTGNTVALDVGFSLKVPLPLDEADRAGLCGRAAVLREMLWSWQQELDALAAKLADAAQEEKEET